MNPPPLTDREKELLSEVFSRHPEVAAVKLFGSRAKGVHQPNSDVDLAVWGDLDPIRAEALAAELDELPIPYHFDVKAFELIEYRKLREHIERMGILLYSRS